MHKLILFFSLILFVINGRSQSIYSALHLNEEREYKTKRPERIDEVNIFFNSNGLKTVKAIKHFDSAGMLLSEERLDENGKLSTRLTFTNDTVHRKIISMIFESWTVAGYTKESSFYSYSKEFYLIGITNMDANGTVLRKTDLICNDKGHPVELALYDGKGNLVGREIAAYLYDKNKAVSSVIATNGKVLTTDTIKISFVEASRFPDSGDVYNEHGDLIRWVSMGFNGDSTLFENEYLYDGFGNCIEESIFKVTVKRNGTKKRKDDRIFRKTYIY